MARYARTAPGRAANAACHNVEQAIAELDPHDRDRAEIRMVLAMLRLTQGDPHAATTALAPVLDGSAPMFWPAWLTQAFLLEAIARDTIGDAGGAASALEHALELAEPNGAIVWFLLHPAPDLLGGHRTRRTRHASLIVKTHIRNLYQKLGAHSRTEAVARARALGLLAPSAHRG